MEELDTILPDTQWDNVQNLSVPTLRCQGSLIPIWLHVSMGPAFAVGLLLSFLQKRKNIQQCCWGRPSCPVPLNLLDQYENRWTYAAAFGAILNLLISVFLGFDGQYFLQLNYPTYLKSLYTMFYIEMVCISFYPIFVCLNTEFRLVGSIIGLLYSLLWFAVKIQGLVDCIAPYSDLLQNITLVINVPSIICLGFVVVRYFSLTIKNIRSGSCSESETNTKLAPGHMFRYVKRLLAKPSWNYSEKDKSLLQMVHCELKKSLKNNLYDKDVPFKYSTRIICVFFASLMFLYLIGSLQFLVCARFLKASREFVTVFNNVTNGVFQNTTSVGRSVKIVYNMVKYSWEIPNALVTLVFAFGLIRLLVNYRKHTLMLYKGDTSFIPESYFENVQPSKFVASTTRFAGYQIAYMLWGQLIFTAVGVLFSLLFCFVVLLPPIFGNFWLISFVLQAFGIPLAVGLVVYVLMEIAAEVFFSQDKMEKDDSSKPLAFDNLRAFHAWDFYMLIAYITTSLISCLFGVLMNLFIALIYLSRMDRSVLMAGFENLDTGFNAYIGMLMVERYNNHPVLRTFCQVTAEASQKDNHCSKYGEVYDVESDCVDGNESDLERKRRSTRAVTKWHLAYTLINNPKLKDERNHPLGQKEECGELNEENGQDTQKEMLRCENSSKNLEQNNFENIDGGTVVHAL